MRIGKTGNGAKRRASCETLSPAVPLSCLSQAIASRRRRVSAKTLTSRRQLRDGCEHVGDEDAQGNKVSLIPYKLELIRIANRQSLAFSELGRLSQAIPQFHMERTLHQRTPFARLESQRNEPRVYEDQILSLGGVGKRQSPHQNVVYSRTLILV